jgi:hypothetical protein
MAIAVAVASKVRGLEKLAQLLSQLAQTTWFKYVN